MVPDPAVTGSHVAADLTSAITSALEVLRSRAGRFDPDAIIDLYGRIIRLSAQAERVLAALAAHPDPAEPLPVDDIAELRQLFRRIEEFSAAMVRLDLLVMDVYAPEVLADLARVMQPDASIYWVFNNKVAPRHGIDEAPVPPFLRHLLDESEVGPDSLWELEKFVLGFSPLREHDEDARRIGQDARASLHDLVTGLAATRASLAAFARSNVPLTNLARRDGAGGVAVGVHMGDSFSNVHGSTIVNRSAVDRSFNTAAHGDPQLREALERLAQFVADSGDAEAASTFDALTAELQQPGPRKGVLRILWKGLVDALPAINQLADAVGKVTALFG